MPTVKENVCECFGREINEIQSHAMLNNDADSCKKPNLTNIYYKVKPVSFSSAITTTLAASLSLRKAREHITGKKRLY